MIRLKKRLTTIAALFAVACASLAHQAHAAEPNKLESIEVQALPGQQVQLKLHLTGPAPEPLPFTIDKPARIALDLPNTTLGLPQRRIDVRSGGVDTVLAAEANGRTRVVVNVDTMIPYSTKVDGNTILVTLGAAPVDSGTRMAARGAATLPP